MPDIIEQLEKGKELLDKGEIDLKSLRTKIDESENESEEKRTKKPTKNRKNNSKARNNNNETQDTKTDTQTEDKLDKAENNDSTQSEESVVKEEKYPGFDFTQNYNPGDIIFYVRVNRLTGDIDVLELRLRTIYPKMMVGCILGVKQEACVQVIGPDVGNCIFSNRYDAVNYSNTVTVTPKYSEEGEY